MTEINAQTTIFLYTFRDLVVARRQKARGRCALHLYGRDVMLRSFTLIAAFFYAVSSFPVHAQQCVCDDCFGTIAHMKYNSQNAGDWIADLYRVDGCLTNSWRVVWLNWDGPPDTWSINREGNDVSGSCNMDAIYSASGFFINAQHTCGGGGTFTIYLWERLTRDDGRRYTD
ncbi:hypothetical protein J1C49_12735 [Cognatishimia sp. F0-27]|nr:hypothetical protein [Cognatishimia sp. F0-27]